MKKKGNLMDETKRSRGRPSDIPQETKELILKRFFEGKENIQDISKDTGISQIRCIYLIFKNQQSMLQKQSPQKHRYTDPAGVNI